MVNTLSGRFFILIGLYSGGFITGIRREFGSGYSSGGVGSGSGDGGSGDGDGGVGGSNDGDDGSRLDPPLVTVGKDPWIVGTRVVGQLPGLKRDNWMIH